MGDRCYMKLTCRRQDLPRFEPLGFVVDHEADPNSPLVELMDEEANYAHHGDLPRDVPFLAEHGPGGNSGNGRVACDGQRYADVEAGHDGGFVIAWTRSTSKPNAASLRAVRDYLAVEQAVQRAFLRLARPKPHA